MPDFIDFRCETIQKEILINPNQFTYNLGEICSTCYQNVVYHESISFCNCYKYCHESCLIKELSTHNSNSEENIIKCEKCKRKLNVFYELQVVAQPECKMFHIIGILIMLLIIVSCIAYVIKLSDEQVLYQMIISVVLACSFLLLVFFVMNVILQRKFNIVKIKGTNLGLVVSAFADLEKDVYSEETECEITKN